MSRHQPTAGADSPDAAVTYRVPLRSLDSDHTFTQIVSAYGPRDLSNHLVQLELRYPDYHIGRPRQVVTR